MQYDIWKFFTLLLLAGILGFSLGNTSLVMLLMAIGIIVWQVHQLNALYRWMINPRKNSAPETSGQTYRLHREIKIKNASVSSALCSVSFAKPPAPCLTRL